MADRGQTAHDYLIGVSIMLVTLFGIFAFVPGIFQPFQEPIGTDEEAMADRVGDHLVTDHAVAGARNTLDGDALKTTLTDDSAFLDLLQRAGVPADRRQVNVTVSQADGTRVDTGATWSRPSDEHVYFVNQSVSATTIRVVQFQDGRCDPVCRIIVRVW